MPLTAGGTAVGSFATPLGWTVTLSQALIALGPFYFNVDPPSTDEFRSGVVIIQATEQTIVNAIDPTHYPVTGGANGEAGTAVAVEIDLFTPNQENQCNDPTDSFTIGSVAFGYVAGTATMGSATVPFQGPVGVDQDLVTPTASLLALERIQGAAADLTFTSAPDTLQLVVDPTHWFDQCDFSQIAVGPPPTGGYSWPINGSTFADQLLQGAQTDNGVYNFSLVPN
jgi:hypothetical protein